MNTKNTTKATLVVGVSMMLAACSSGSSEQAPASNTDTPVLALVTGKLAATDPMMAKAQHDQTAATLKSQGQAAGDVSHDALLAKDAAAGAGMAGGASPIDFLGLDQWTSTSAATSFYASAAVKQDFSVLFSAAPDISVWTTRDGWTTWGATTLVQKDANAYVITLRGQFQGTIADAQMTHNALVAAVPAPGPVGQGNTAHMPMANPNDPTELLIIEVWDNEANQQHLYSDPQFQAALSHFWIGQPVVTRWQNPSWSQW